MKEAKTEEQWNQKHSEGIESLKGENHVVVEYFNQQVQKEKMNMTFDENS